MLPLLASTTKCNVQKVVSNDMYYKMEQPMCECNFDRGLCLVSDYYHCFVNELIQVINECSGDTMHSHLEEMPLPLVLYHRVSKIIWTAILPNFFLRIRIMIYLLDRRNLLWDILRLPSSRRAALGLYVILTL